MAEALTELRHLTGRLRALRNVANATPLDYVRWLPMQEEFLKEEARRRLLRLGNQWGGKTWVGLANGIMHCLGEHPFYDVPAPPIKGAIVCATWAQSIEIQEKLWHLLPKGELHPDTVYIPGHGFRGKNICVRFRNGSMIFIKTTNQGGLSLAGGTYDWVHFDEPPKNARVYSEMVKRTLRGAAGGFVWLTFTPVNAPVEYIREMCESKEHKMVDLHSRCTPEMLIPIGANLPIRINGVPADQNWIDAQEADSFEYEVDVVVHGGWEFRSSGRMFSAYHDAVPPKGHTVTEAPPFFGGEFELCFGADHGSGANFSSCAVLVGTVKTPEGFDAIWVLDEYVSDGLTTEQQDARGVIEMLARWGWKWSNLNKAHGDRVHYGAGGKYGRQQGKKSNGQLQRAIAREMGIQAHEMGVKIGTVKRGKGHAQHSVKYGERWLHRAMVRGHFHVSKRCERVIGMLNSYSGIDDQWKHVCDALRYSLVHAIFAQRQRSSAPIHNG